jgi:NitT/TauT family transport system ATP-binding protein
MKSDVNAGPKGAAMFGLQAAGQMRVEGVGKAYGHGAQRKVVIDGCSFDIPAGKLTVMIGPSGCGKSTLIRLLAGFEAPSAGRITLNGRPVTGPDRSRLVVFQESALFPWMTTWQNILYGPAARGMPKAVAHARAEQLLTQVGLRAFRDKYPTQLSGGMQRRVELARALINDPELMILDEPFRGLDAMSRELMWGYYAALFEDGAQQAPRTHFFVTTDIDEAIFLADRLLVMTHGPTRVREVLAVDLPRPRRLTDVFHDAHANDVKMRALSLLHEEAMKSFVGGSKAAADLLEAFARRRTGSSAGASTGVNP